MSTSLRFLVLTAWLLSPNLFAQKDDIFNYGNKKRQDEMADACRSQTGGILSCGSAESEDGDGWDGLLIKINHLGKLGLRKRIGLRAWNEHALAVAEDSDGKIWIGGYSDSLRIHRAWLMCCNPAGGPIWDRPLYRTTDIQSAVQDIVPSSNGQNMAIAGVSGGRVWFGLWGLNGEKRFEPKKIERIDGQLNLVVEKVVLVEGQSGWFLYGNGKIPGGKRQLFFVKLDAAGDLVASALLLPDKKIISSGGCVLTKGGNLLGVGTADGRPYQEEAFTIYMPENLDKQEMGFQTFGGYNNAKHRPGKLLDEANDIVVLDEKTCLVAGSTQSHKNVAQVPDFATWRVDHYGHRLDFDMRTSGKELAERGVKVLRMYSGDVWVCGNQNDGNRVRDDENFAFDNIESLSLPFAAVESGALALNVPESAPTLQPGSTSVLAVEIVNQSANQIEGLYITAECSASTPGCYTGLRYTLPPLQAGVPYVANIPLWAEREALTGDTKLNLKLNRADGRMLTQKNTNLKISMGKAPKIKLISAVSNLSKKQQLVRGKKTFVDITFRNEGDADATDVTIAVSEPDGAELSILKDYKTSLWKIGETQTIQIALTANGFGKARNIPLKIFLNAANLPESPTYQTIFDLVDEELASPQQTENINTNVDLEIQWDDNNDLMDRRTNKGKYELHTRISSNIQVSLDDLMLIHAYAGRRDSILFRGVKSDEVQFKKTNASTVHFIYRASQLLTLKPGDNVLQIVVKKNGKRAETAPMTVRLIANESTLHIVSIGVPDEKERLKYTQKDAIDIARLFLQQENKLYGTVNTTILNSRDSTRGAVISGVLNNFRLMQDQGRLKPSDAVIVFISSHGIISDQDSMFRLAGSDFERLNEKYTSLSFRDDVLAKLAGLDCQVFVMLDACHSAAAEGRKDFDDIAKHIIDDFNKAPKRVRLIASCKEQESSYEDKAWENSAFAEILQKILGDKNTCATLDTDGNGYLTLKELFARFPEDVNTLIRTVRPGETQTPYVSKEILNEVNPVPFWVY
ncbi:MAG: caspase family protein [Phycisphaerae bacterium]|nr:caspase family protein [Saprospiraceae bacterium]